MAMTFSWTPTQLRLSSAIETRFCIKMLLNTIIDLPWNAASALLGRIPDFSILELPFPSLVRPPNCFQIQIVNRQALSMPYVDFPLLIYYPKRIITCEIWYNLTSIESVVNLFLIPQLTVFCFRHDL